MTVVSAVTLGFTHGLVTLMTPGRIVRPFIILLCDRDGVLEERAPRSLLLKVVIPYVPLLIMALLFAFSAIDLFAGGARQGTPGHPAVFHIFAPASVLYVFAYLLLGIAHYRSTYSAIQDSWEKLLGADSSRLIREALISDAERVSTYLWPLFAFGIPFVWTFLSLESSQVEHYRTADTAIVFMSGLVAMLSLVTVQQIERLVPHKRVIGTGLKILVLLRSDHHAMFFNTRPPSFAAARWRTQLHQAGFDLARSIEKSVLGLHRRLADEDYARLNSAFSKVSNLLRKRAITAEGSECSGMYYQLVSCSLALLVSEDPMRAVAFAEQLTAEEPEMEKRPNKFLLILEKLNEHIQTSWGTLKIIGTLVTIFVIAISGTWAPIVDFFLSQK